MPLVATEAIVLQAFAYSDTSKILRLLTPSHGVVSAMARGALRPRSQYGGVLEPFTEGNARFYLKDGRELQTMAGFDLVRSRQTLGRDLVRFGAASLMAELVIRTATADPDAPLYHQVRCGLDRLEAVPSEELERCALAEAWSLVARLGFAPGLDQCLGCGRELAEKEETVLDYDSGGARCVECGAGVRGTRLPDRARSTLRGLCEGRMLEVPHAASYWTLLERFVGYHVVDGRPLRSLEFMTGALEDR